MWAIQSPFTTRETLTFVGDFLPWHLLSSTESIRGRKRFRIDHVTDLGVNRTELAMMRKKEKRWPLVVTTLNLLQQPLHSSQNTSDNPIKLETGWPKCSLYLRLWTCSRQNIEENNSCRSTDRTMLMLDTRNSSEQGSVPTHFCFQSWNPEQWIKLGRSRIVSISKAAEIFLEHIWQSSVIQQVIWRVWVTAVSGLLGSKSNVDIVMNYMGRGMW